MEEKLLQENSRRHSVAQTNCKGEVLSSQLNIVAQEERERMGPHTSKVVQDFPFQVYRHRARSVAQFAESLLSKILDSIPSITKNQELMYASNISTQEVKSG